MLTKYKLTNIPEGGVFHILPGRRRVSIVKEMTNQQADELISLGVSQYFLPANDQSNGEEQNSSTSSTGDQSGTGSGADHSESGNDTTNGTTAGDHSGNDIEYGGDEPYVPVVVGTDAIESGRSEQPGTESGNDQTDRPAISGKRKSSRTQKD